MSYHFQTDLMGDFIILRLIDSNDHLVITLMFDRVEARVFTSQLRREYFGVVDVYPYTIAVLDEGHLTVISISENSSGYMKIKIALNTTQVIDLERTMELQIANSEFSTRPKDYTKPKDDEETWSQEKEQDTFGNEDDDSGSADWWKKDKK